MEYMSYKGVVDDCRLFTWVYKTGESYYIQQKSYFDRNTGYVKYIEYITNCKMPNGEMLLITYKSNYSNEGNNLSLLNGEANLEWSNGNTYNIKLDNIYTTKRPGKFKEDVLVRKSY